MSDNLIMLCVVLAVMAGIAVPFIRRAIRHRKTIGANVPQEEITVEVQPKDRTAEDIYLFRYICPDRGPIGSNKTIRIRPEYYDRIRAIAHIVGKNELSLIAYLDNVLKAHFDDNRDIINALYRNNTDELFKSGE